MMSDYSRAQKLGQRQVQHDVSAGRYPYPPALDDILRERGYLSEIPMGTTEIPLALIAGTRTRGRQDSFSSGFMPLLEPGSEFATKWSNLYDSQVTEGIRDPIVVYEYLQRFYVQEGNKRVSVLSYLGAPSIMARVTRVVPMPSDDKSARTYQEFVRFYRVCPVYGISVSWEGAYERLAVLAGQTLDEPWPTDVVRDLRSAFMSFAEAFWGRGGHDLELEVGDAFIIFLGIYGFDAVVAMVGADVREGVERVWGELVLTSHGGAIAYLEDPGDVSPKSLTGLASKLKETVAPKPFKVAFIHERDARSSGWVALHERGRIELEDVMGSYVKTISFMNSADDKAFDQAIAEAAERGVDLVVTTAATQMSQALRAAASYPQMAFLNCSVSLSHSAVRTFSARMYEVKFLLGALAASMATNHRVGYVAKAPLYGSVAEINAFAIGAQMVDKDAKVHLKWFLARDCDWREALLDEGVRVICAGDYPSPTQKNEPWGLFVVGEDGSTRRIAQPIWRWGRAYELIVQSIRSNAWQKEGDAFRDRALNYWWGMSSGICDVKVLDVVPHGQRVLVELLRQSLLSGRLTPFADELRSQDGLIQEEGSGKLPSDSIARMSWLNENVVGRLPSSGELRESALKQVEVSGVIPPGPGDAPSGGEAS